MNSASQKPDLPPKPAGAGRPGYAPLQKPALPSKGPQASDSGRRMLAVLLGVSCGVALAVLLAIGIGIVVYLSLDNEQQTAVESQNGSSEKTSSREDEQSSFRKTDLTAQPTADKPSTPVKKRDSGKRGGRAHFAPKTPQNEPVPDGLGIGPRNPDRDAGAGRIPDNDLQAEKNVPSERPPAGSAPNPPEAPLQNPPVTLPDTASPFETIREQNRILALPKFDARRESPAAELAKIHLPPAADLQMQLLGTDVLTDADYQVSFQRESSVTVPKWTLLQSKKIRPSFIPPGDAEKEIAAFELSNDSLLFQWKCNKPPAIRLASCLLKLTVDQQSVICYLGEPARSEPIEIEFPEQASQVAIPLSADALARRDQLRVDLQLPGFPDHNVQGSLSGLRPGDVCVLQFDGQGFQKQLLEIRIELRWRDSESRPAFVIERFAFPVDIVDTKYRSPKITVTDSNSRTVRTSNTMINPVILQTRSEEYLAKVERNQDKLDSQKASVQQVLDRLQKSQESSTSRLESLDETIDRYTRFMNEYPDQRNYYRERVQRYNADRQPLLQQIENLKRQIEQVKKQLPRELQIKTLVEENLEYAKQLSPLMASLKANGQIHFDAYIEIENERVVLVTTQPAKSPGNNSNASVHGVGSSPFSGGETHFSRLTTPPKHVPDPSALHFVPISQNSLP